MSGYCIACQEKPQPPRVVVVGLASCFGCQLQITNVEEHLLDVLGQIDLRYWQLTSSEPMPDAFDVAVIEGAVTTVEAEETVRQLRERAGAVIAIGACATTAGIPGMAAAGFLRAAGPGVRPRARGLRRHGCAAARGVRHRRRLRGAHVPGGLPRFHRRAPACALRLEQGRAHAHDVRRLQAQRDELLLRQAAAVPGSGDAGRVRRALREPGAALQRVPRAVARREPALGARGVRALRRAGG